jgi:hypothetical protein
MNSENQSDLGWNFLLAISSLVALVAAVLLVWNPNGRDDDLIKAQAKLPKVQGAAIRAQQRALANQVAVQGQLSDVGFESLGSQTLDSLTALAKAHHLALSGFRSERPVDVGQLTEAPYVAVLEGGFSDVMAVAKKLEDPHAKLALKMFEISAADTASDRVIATVGLVGFLPGGKV